MNISTLSIAWAFLQISLLCSLALVVAWSLGGRRPQLVTAILAGTCLASLFLAVISVVPRLQWTLAIDEAAPVVTIATNTPKAIEAGSNPPISATTDAGDTPVKSGQLEIKGLRGQTGPNGLDAVRTFLSKYLRRVDREVRDAEAWQQPVSKARNYSILIFVSTGLIAMSLLWCTSWFYMKRILRSSLRVVDPGMLCLIATQARGFGLKRIPSVRESNLVSIGATVGWRRVTVLLHTDWREWSGEEQIAVIAHELAHAARHDFAWVIVSSWTRIFLFFHPMVHALIHRLRLEQELAADQLAAGKVGNASAYGRALARLALRSQQSMGTSNAKLGSMLAAGQICVTRRVTMLRQGSLKPIPSRSRWSNWAVVAIACTAIPLAGLRGTTEEPVAKKKATIESTTQIDSTEQEKPATLSREFLAAYPPVEFKGSMVYRPGRFRAGEFGPEAAWFQEWFAISAFGKPMPDRAVAYGECNGILRWTDEERVHGRFDLAASFREGESTLPGQLSKMADPFNWLGRKMRVVSKQQVGGRTITEVADSTADEKSSKWMIDDEQGYFIGSNEQAVRFASGQTFALDSIPEYFHEDYKNAAFAMVYDHCDQWQNKLETHFKDAPNLEASQVFAFKQQMEILNDLKQLGVFVDGCSKPACSMRAVMRNEDAAKRLATQMTTLLALGRVALATKPSKQDKLEEEAASSILDTMQITAKGSEVLFQFDIFIPSLGDESMASFHSKAGWIKINVDATCDTTDAVKVRPAMGFSTPPSLMGQTLDASEYRGKDVLLELEMQCNQDAASEAGAFVWASRQEPLQAEANSGRLPRQSGSPYVGHRVLAAKSVAADGSAAWTESLKSERRMERVSLLPDAPSRKLTVPFTVPSNAEHISFGFYIKNSEIRVSNVKFQVADEVANQTVSSSIVTDATADVPYNVMVVPGYTIRRFPLDLNFEQFVPNSIEFAARADGNQSR